MVMESLTSALHAWRTEGIHIQPGYPSNEVVALLARAGRWASTDVIELFAACNGMTRGQSDRDFFSLWPIEQCAQECAGFERECIPFADFLISSHEYFLRRESVDRSSVWISSGTQVASSLEEFFHLLVVDRRSLNIVLR